ncbi:hypothetical protein BC937DRAFT_88115 [Endogone sp. FLAS-F59071]|nr:hypothetical protein BC937DRAFT_88115 [Endogone sp. FLAS-F59071]|eukprot:RUS18974.1 hypothetical protein BC937DRAFT_88115 [Endogone sp. FLAS-F59071]
MYVAYTDAETTTSLSPFRNSSLPCHPMSDFAPYQPAPDDRSRSKAKLKAPAPPPAKPSLKYQPVPTRSSPLAQSASALEAGVGSSSSAAPGAGQVRVNKYETSLPVRVDVEAALTYALGAVTGVFFLIVEQKNDYVRFHAWQSSLLFLALMLLQFIIMFISSWLSWLLFFIDIALIAWLGYHAYMDGASLERYEVPYFGAIAAEWVDAE